MIPKYLAVAGGAVALSWSLTASANGRFPQSNQVLFSTTDPNLVVARTTFGILPSHDNGQTWAFVCEDALGIPSNSMTVEVDPEMGLTASNALLGALMFPPGLSVSPDTGCTWTCAGGPLAGQPMADLAVRLDAPHSVVTITSVAGVDGGVQVFSTQVFQSTDDGSTWSPLGVPIPDPTFQAKTVDVAKTDPQRIYISGNDGLAPNRTATVWTSKDSGQTWTPTQLPHALFDPTQEDSIFIGAVDPTDADRLYLRSSALPMVGGLSRLSTSTDGAATFTQVQSFQIGGSENSFMPSGEIAGFALSPDGSKIYSGTRERGLWVAQRSDMNFKMVSPIHIFCLATRNDELWVCSDDGSTYQAFGMTTANAFLIGMSKDDGVTFTPKLSTVTCLTGLLDCSHAASTSLGCNATLSGGECADPFNMYCTVNDVPGGPCNCTPVSTAAPQPEGGATTDAGMPPPHSTSSSSCGCSVVGEPRVAGALASVAVVGLTLGRRRRRSRKHGAS